MRELHTSPLPTTPTTAVGSGEVTSPVHTAGALPAGFRDAFLERRFRLTEELPIEKLAAAGVLAFLSKATHVDELYELNTPTAELSQGLYRIREEGSDHPLLTVKRHGDGISTPSETIDLVHPSAELLATVRSQGTLRAVISKTRQTYASKHHPHCLLHLDSVEGLGSFIDVKADDARVLEQFLKELNLPAAAPTQRSYLALKTEKGISPLQLSVWKFQQRFEDYIMGVVSGTLTPLAFLATTAASGGSKPAMILALLTAGICDGFSDAVAASQTTQSDLRPSFLKQLSLFGKTLLGKVVVPLTFIPCVIGSSSSLTTIVTAGIWAGIMLGATAAVQAVAHERRALPAVAKILGLSTGALLVGTSLGKYIPPLLTSLIGASP